MERGLRVVGVPIGADWIQNDFAREVTMGKPAELLRVLVKMEDAQASFQIMRLSASTRLTFLLRPLPLSSTARAAGNFNAFLEWALVSMIAGEGANKVGLVRPEEVASGVETYNGQTLLGPEALSQARLAIPEGGAWPHKQRGYQGSGLHGMQGPSSGQSGGRVSESEFGCFPSETAATTADGQAGPGAQSVRRANQEVPAKGYMRSLLDIGRPGQRPEEDRGRSFITEAKDGGPESCGEEEGDGDRGK